MAGVLIEKLPETWNHYKQQLKHKQKQLSLSDLITHIIIEDTNRKAIQAEKGKQITAKANLVEGKPHNKRHASKYQYKKKSDYKPSDSNPKFKKNGSCFSVASQNILLLSVGKRLELKNERETKILQSQM